ncbi:hypothetical protein BJ165DRAFT_1112529 [Panaeolus papilionaceus]|nr:hypothetical protein BJ165DRAFT_1112529 [Panaeolus papilionaceus]
MIILSKVPAEQDDQASIHTLVESTNSPTNDNLRIRRLLTPLIFASLGFSSATFAFSVYNFSLSTLHAIPIFVAFILSIPVHVGIIFVLWRLSSHAEFPELPTSITGTKARRVTYVIVVQIAWLVAAVICPMVLTNRWEMTGGFCKAKTEMDLCEGRAQVTFSPGQGN